MKGFKLTFLLLAALLAQPVWAGIAVVVGKDTVVPQVSEEDLRSLFKGQRNTLGGTRFNLLDMPEGSALRDSFYVKLLNKHAAQMRSYRARMIFTGKGAPPRAVSGVPEMKVLLHSGDRPYIGYMDSNQVTPDLRVLIELN
ncbi:hypothetical protein MWU49_08845 [Alcanivorax sp. S6407]|uniref:hypothetical protein n=1 Tax=Alcanivorax sp. S6407 TaxID=2926424 RepID=UPI001FF3F7AA|nr:hypothetical protein [Alcanivorax sp. S6407]MCK0153808.1 hypothetical protein [Alcanivorax sp. S6407]